MISKHLIGKDTLQSCPPQVLQATAEVLLITKMNLQNRVSCMTLESFLTSLFFSFHMPRVLDVLAFLHYIVYVKFTHVSLLPALPWNQATTTSCKDNHISLLIYLFATILGPLCSIFITSARMSY